MSDRLKIDENGKYIWEGEELYIIVDQGTCIACGSCMCWSPDVFTYNELSIAENRLDNNTGTKPIPKIVWEDALPTLRLCPVKAIKGSDQPHIGFVHTPEFGKESPDNPNINYDIVENEWTINELTDNQLTPISKDYGVKSEGCGCGSSCGCGGHEYIEQCSCENHQDSTCGCGGSPEDCTCGRQKK